MQENTDTAQLELLAKIHNQLVDLKKILVEIESVRPGTPHELQARLRQIVAADKHIDAASGAAPARQHQTIAPTNTNITPGEGKDSER